jgi:AcrR family transcriptional regulator
MDLPIIQTVLTVSYGSVILLAMVAAATPRALRRTQEARASSTRRRILDAALECLSTLGYAATTTLVVAQRAGVSRGAQLHHFPTRASLVSAAVQHLFAGLRSEYEAAFANLSPDADRVGAAIDLLWEIFQDVRLAAVLELYVVGRTDPGLRAELAPVAASHHENVVRLARAYFPEAADLNGGLEELLDLVLDTLQGMAVRRLVRPQDASTTRTLALVKSLAAAAIAAQRSSQRKTR